MDVISAASSLRQQLVALDNSDSTISLLESKLESLGGQSLMSAIEENQSHHLRLLLRVSVTEGVRHMYQQYSNTKWAQVQSTARSIKSTLEADGIQQTTPLMTSSPRNSRPSMDKAADEWTSAMCELSRHE